MAKKPIERHSQAFSLFTWTGFVFSGKQLPRKSTIDWLHELNVAKASVGPAVYFPPNVRASNGGKLEIELLLCLYHGAEGKRRQAKKARAVLDTERKRRLVPFTPSHQMRRLELFLRSLHVIEQHKIGSEGWGGAK